MSEKAVCRNCGRVLKQEYCGGGVYHPDTGERVPMNFYGGFVCSRNCDIRVCLAMSSSMPGAGIAKHLNSLEREQVERNWKEMS